MRNFCTTVLRRAWGLSPPFLTAFESGVGLEGLGSLLAVPSLTLSTLVVREAGLGEIRLLLMSEGLCYDSY